MTMTTQEKKLKAGIPGPDTGIEVRKTFCDICAPTFHCGIDAYIRDGRVVKVEGTKGHPMNNGVLCAKGACNRAYIYRPDRIRTPLMRTGPKGSDEFKPVTWEEAYDIISEKLLGIRERFGAESVAFYCGYEKWFRFLMQRFAYSFGSPNFGTESGTCFTAGLMAWRTMAGEFSPPDMMNTRLHLAWGASPYSSYKLTNAREALAKRGGKIIVIDIMDMPDAERKADLFIRINPGTDGLLAACIAGLIIKNDLHDKEYIQKYVHGFEAYREYVLSLDINEVSRITGVGIGKIEKAAEMIGSIKPMSMSAGSAAIMHQWNGYQTLRGIFALSAITGNYDIAGGNRSQALSFCHQGAGYETREDEFSWETTPKNQDARIGAARFPLWAKLIHEMQPVDLPRQILEETPYPVHGLFSLGMNYRIFPNSDYTKKAIEKLDFFVDTDLFMTDTARMADIVLPACSSFEREEMKVYPGGFAKYYQPVIEPLYESRSDARILQDLAKKMKLGDDMLEAGYRQDVEYIFRDIGYDFDTLCRSELPVRIPVRPRKDHEDLEKGCHTPTGKLELYSGIIASCGEQYKLDPLPKWEANPDPPDKEYPFLLLAGIRIPNALHSRLHKVSWERFLRPDPAADLNPEDARRAGIRQGDDIYLVSEYGEIKVKANISPVIGEGRISMYHGYSEADVNKLIGPVYDPYSGFPGFKCARCAVRKAAGGANVL